MTFLNSTRKDSFQDARREMVEHQIARRGVQDPRVLSAMATVPREEFVDAKYREDAYVDRPLPIGSGQTISQPYTVAMMCEAAQIGETDKVLEIGAGSGYGAAVLSRLAQSVHAVERLPELAKAAEERLQRLGYENVKVHTANGTMGLKEESPFDAIIVTAGARELPQPLVDQLSDGGRIIIPIGSHDGQTMFRYTRRGDDLSAENLGSFAFVPLIGEHGWHES